MLSFKKVLCVGLLAFIPFISSTSHAADAPAAPSCTYEIPSAVYDTARACVYSLAYQVADSRPFRIGRKIAHNRIDMGLVPQVQDGLNRTYAAIATQMQLAAVRIIGQIQGELDATYNKMGYPVCLLIKDRFGNEASSRCASQDALNKYWQEIQADCNKKTGNEQAICNCIAGSIYNAMPSMCQSLVRTGCFDSQLNQLHNACVAKLPDFKNIFSSSDSKE